ncbi:hypothetical protein OBP_305 [Pseudomonas phage OBP]|uniref:hypothetical protein n=1 Tax=Pseudomonas phage OBP TaxID=1124849 RepID=UPI000240D64C|nr:hypothetical protein OBP_305 [Pseudomonas phage OBP]AEV89742.1 hypothetical protein OBP_305 [Pseudomonas phage OBP]
MKNFFKDWGSILGINFGYLAILIIGLSSINSAFAKTPLVVEAMDKQTFSMVGIKEVKPEGELGIIFVCHKDEDEATVVIQQPVIDNEVPVITGFTFVKYDQSGSESVIVPYSTVVKGIWNIRTAIRVMRDPSYSGTYAIRFHKADGGYVETRKFYDSELKRLWGDRKLKGCDTSHVKEASSWEHVGEVDYNVYKKYQ